MVGMWPLTNALELTLTKKSFLRSKVQLFIYNLQFYEAFLLPMDLHSQEAIGRPYFLNLTELKLHSGLIHIGCHLFTSPRESFYSMYMLPGGRQVPGRTLPSCCSWRSHAKSSMLTAFECSDHAACFSECRYAGL